VVVGRSADVTITWGLRLIPEANGSITRVVSVAPFCPEEGGIWAGSLDTVWSLTSSVQAESIAGWAPA
jgi:hypothetical protein